nr:hypothetical protein [Tanacetum cinerariifolium]
KHLPRIKGTRGSGSKSTTTKSVGKWKTPTLNETSFAIPSGLETERFASSSVIYVGVCLGSESPSHTESGMRFMLAPRSANARHSSIPENSQGMRNFPGQYSKRARIAQSSALPTVLDEPASPVIDVSKGETCPTESSFIADQDRVTIAKSFTLPHDSAPRVTSLVADEGSMDQTISELTGLCTSLQRQHSELLAKFQAQEVEILRLKERVQVLEDRESVAAKQSGDDAPIKGRSINKGEAAAERISDDSEELARVLTSMDAATVLAGGIDVPTGSGFIPTAGLGLVFLMEMSERSRGVGCGVVSGSGGKKEENGVIRLGGKYCALHSVLKREVTPDSYMSHFMNRPCASQLSTDYGSFFLVGMSERSRGVWCGVRKWGEKGGKRDISPPAANISTGSEVIPTASLIVTSYSKRKGKEVMVESDTPKKQRLQEQIDAQVARELEEQQGKDDMRMNE